MPQTVPVSPCEYSHFAADSFDLSLLEECGGGDGEVPYSPTNIHQLLALFAEAPCSPPPLFQSPVHVKEPCSPQPFFQSPVHVKESLSPQPFFQSPVHVKEPCSPQSMFQSPVHVKESLSPQPLFQSPVHVKEPCSPQSMFQSPVHVKDPCSPQPLFQSPVRVKQSLSPQPLFQSPVHVKEPCSPQPLFQSPVQVKEPCSPPLFHSPVHVKEEPLEEDHRLLREVLRDTSFQRRHNVRPLDLDALAHEAAQQEALDVAVSSDQMEPVLSLAFQQLRRDVDDTCNVLGIASDPSQWTVDDVKAWLLWTLRQYNLPMISMEYFNVDGVTLSSLTEEEFQQRSPQCGSTLYAHLEIWKAARQELESRLDANPWSNATMAPNSCSSGDMSDDEEEDSAPSPPATTGGSSNSNSSTGGGKMTRGASHIHLWQFLKELLASPQVHGSCIRWLERNKGVFKIEDSVRVARLWGKRKNRPAMNYDKLSRSIRQYYKKGIMKKTERSQRLVYQFCHPYCL